MQPNEITHKIIGSAYAVANQLGAGFLEKIYENSLFIELKKQGLMVHQQKAIGVYYDSVLVGEYVADRSPRWYSGMTIAENSWSLF